jgi:hypothetical protein
MYIGDGGGRPIRLIACGESEQLPLAIDPLELVLSERVEVELAPERRVDDGRGSGVWGLRMVVDVVDGVASKAAASWSGFVER